MKSRPIDPARKDEDWEGNNAAVTCNVCGEVFLVSGHIHSGERSCPSCGQTRVVLKGGRKSRGTAMIVER
jgi:rubrerythrin